MRLFRLVAGLALLAATTPATTFEAVSHAELAQRSRVVCAVRCESRHAERDPRSGLVFTHLRFRLLEDLRGRSDAGTFELRLAGGEADGVRTVVPGMPEFAAGEECVLLLGPVNADGFPTLVAARRGVLRLGRDAEGARFLRDRASGFDELRGKRRVGLADFRRALREDERRRREAEAKERAR